MRKDYRQLAIILLAVAIFSALFLVGYLKYSKQSSNGPIYAPNGELISGFPKELILDSEVAIEKSYSISYNAEVKQYTASFVSSKSMESLFSDYKQYFDKNDWEITNENKNYSNSRGIYAKRGDEDVDVAIKNKTEKREVNISYLKRGDRPSVPAQKLDKDFPLNKYFDFTKIKPYNVRDEKIDGVVRFSAVSFKTGHMSENYKIIKNNLLSSGFTFLYDVSTEGSFDIAARKDNQDGLVEDLSVVGGGNVIDASLMDGPLDKTVYDRPLYPEPKS